VSCREEVRVQKENLVLVNSFPTNSILLKGLIEYLNDHFNVYFIDLPGFTKQVPPLPKISFEGYSRFVESKIEEFGLESYIVGGISFGFLIVNNAQHGQRCKAIIAMEPYTGPRSLRMGLLKKVLSGIPIKVVGLLRLWPAIWGSRLFRTYWPKLRHWPPGTSDVILEQVDARTYFETADLILSDRGDHELQAFPHVLIGNKDDRTVNWDYILRVFTEIGERLLVVNTTMEHWPAVMTKEYFRSQIPEEDIKRIHDFVSSG
jgi:pimeloyl-ACP methyl ester carboxylesterase